MIKECLVCGNLFDTTKTGRYKYCSEKCAKSRNNNNYPKDLSTFRHNNPMQVELEGDGYADGELVYDFGKCPNCGWEFEKGDKDWEESYCCHCGQRLKWFETQGSDHKCNTCKHYTKGEYDGSCGSYICKDYSNWERKEA